MLGWWPPPSLFVLGFAWSAIDEQRPWVAAGRRMEESCCRRGAVGTVDQAPECRARFAGQVSGPPPLLLNRRTTSPPRPAQTASSSHRAGVQHECARSMGNDGGEPTDTGGCSLLHLCQAVFAVTYRLQYHGPRQAFL
jgi:hypothetical protein